MTIHTKELHVLYCTVDGMFLTKTNRVTENVTNRKERSSLYANNNRIVLDYCGSCCTVAAAVRTEREAIGLDETSEPSGGIEPKLEVDAQKI